MPEEIPRRRSPTSRGGKLTLPAGSKDKCEALLCDRPAGLDMRARVCHTAPLVHTTCPRPSEEGITPAEISRRGWLAPRGENLILPPGSSNRCDAAGSARDAARARVRHTRPRMSHQAQPATCSRPLSPFRKQKDKSSGEGTTPVLEISRRGCLVPHGEKLPLPATRCSQCLRPDPGAPYAAAYVTPSTRGARFLIVSNQTELALLRRDWLAPRSKMTTPPAGRGGSSRARR